VDVDTGEIVELAEGTSWCKVSHSGRYLACTQAAAPSVMLVRDLTNGETRDVPFRSKNMSFTPDDRFIIYSDGASNFFKVPIEGGDPVQLIAFSGNEAGHSRVRTDLSPDGKWLMYTDYDQLHKFSRTIEYRPGRPHSFEKYPCRLYALNLETFETVELLPYDDLIDPEYGQFSPDGKKFCYIIQNFGVEYYQYSLYVRDFTTKIQTAVDRIEAPEASPHGFAISGNYPNPFNPSTTISLKLPETGTVSLAVYDIIGRKVRDLVNGPLARGAHSLVWDGRDSAGRPVSSGVYLTLLTMNGKSTANRMLLSK
jgi:Tol biopolymer transport system component